MKTDVSQMGTIQSGAPLGRVYGMVYIPLSDLDDPI
jgi:hypothetical protein